jgi:hypothetical protein
MRLEPRILIPAALTAAAIFIPAAPASALGPPGRCPDGFAPVPTSPSTASRDHDGNGWVCAKGPQGSNNHTNYVDDKGNPQPGVVYDPISNTYWNTLDNTAWWVTGNLTYDITQVQDDAP